MQLTALTQANTLSLSLMGEFFLKEELKSGKSSDC
jgi:hypothetical protein